MLYQTFCKCSLWTKQIKEVQKNNLILATFLLFSAKQAAMCLFVYLLEIQNVFVTHVVKLNELVLIYCFNSWQILSKW